jgi:tryptophan-rich sensory protein
VLAICACRLYLGRHSVDQILLGLCLGTLTAIFFHYEARPIIYETLDKPKWKHVQLATFICTVLMAQVGAAYWYVENYVDIP